MARGSAAGSWGKYPLPVLGWPKPPLPTMAASRREPGINSSPRESCRVDALRIHSNLLGGYSRVVCRTVVPSCHTGHIEQRSIARRDPGATVGMEDPIVRRFGPCGTGALHRP